MPLTSKYICKSCKHSYTTETGIADDFLNTYYKVVVDAKTGKYGPEWKAAFDNIIEVAIDCTKHIYECPTCGKWENSMDLSLYIPKDPAALERIKNAAHTVKKWGQVHSVIRTDLKHCYVLYKEYQHICPDCKSKMEHIVMEELSYSLPCPSCGKENTPESVQD